MRTLYNENEVKPYVYRYEAIKFLKSSIDYKLCLGEKLKGISTEIVRIEKFQGFSKGHNFDLYFRLRDNSNWTKCTLVTGLWKTTHTDRFYGNYKSGNTKTLLVFILSPDRRSMDIFEFPKGYYPRVEVIERIIQSL